MPPEILTHSFGWSEASNRYRDLTTGRYVSESLVRQEVNKVVAASSQAMQDITRDLVDGRLSLPEWQLSMEREIKLVNRQCAVAARGGFEQMTQADWGKCGWETKRQYQYLRDFATEIADGTQPLDGRAVNRAGLYGEAGRGTYEEMRRMMAIKKGHTEERRILGPAEHCETSGGLTGCVELSNLGWQPIGTLPRIGQSPCRTHCHCIFEYR